MASNENELQGARFFLLNEIYTPCFTVWVFSPIQSRAIRLTEGNYVQFFRGSQEEIQQQASQLYFPNMRCARSTIIKAFLCALMSHF